MNVIKKSLLAPVMFAFLGAALYAEEDNKQKTSAVQSGLATAATVTGFGLISVGAVRVINGFNAAKIASDMGLVKTAELIASSTSPYAVLLVPGLMLAVGAPVYLYKSAQGASAKKRSILGSAATMAGSALLFGGMGALYIISYFDKPLEVAESVLATVGFQKKADSLKLLEDSGFLISVATIIAGVAGTVAGYGLQL